MQRVYARDAEGNGMQPEQLGAEYRVRALQLHPDKNPGDQGAAESFVRIKEAYAVLSDPQTR